MGWSSEDHWSPRDRDEVNDARRRGFSMAKRHWPSVRSRESTARMRALRLGLGYRGPIDQDGYAVAGDLYDNLPPLLDALRADIAPEDSGEVTW
jgi:hypothetical protein